MRRTTLRMLITAGVIAAALFLSTATPLRSTTGSENLGGTFTQLNAPQNYGSPCENAAITGGVNFKATVFVDEDWGSRPDVRVSVSFSANNQIDGLGNTFTETGSAHAEYDTLSDHYVLPTTLDYDTSNKSLSFIAPSDTTVLVNRATQVPSGFSSTGFAGTCDRR
jgi:hypothetical protein